MIQAKVSDYAITKFKEYLNFVKENSIKITENTYQIWKLKLEGYKKSMPELKEHIESPKKELTPVIISEYQNIVEKETIKVGKNGQMILF